MEPVFHCCVTTSVFNALKEYGLDPVGCQADLNNYLGNDYPTSSKSKKFISTMDVMLVSYWVKLEHHFKMKNVSFFGDRWTGNQLKPFTADKKFIDKHPELYSLGADSFEKYCEDLYKGARPFYIPKETPKVEIPSYFTKLHTRITLESPTYRAFGEYIRI
jgi:hypothetical protein